MYLTIVISLFVIGWIAASVLGTQAYFKGEQSKPIHDRNWNNDGFDRIAKSVTGADTDYGDRVPANGMDAYTSSSLAR